MDTGCFEVGPEATSAELEASQGGPDAVVTDLCLWLRARLDVLDQQVARLVTALTDRAETDGRVRVPGSPHLQ